MPKPGEVNNLVPLQLEQNNKIRLLEPFTGAKQHHKMQCMVCQHIWTATPLSKTQTFKKYGVGGCPKCRDDRAKQRATLAQQPIIEALRQRGVIILSDFTRLRTTEKKLKFKNINCGHEFEAYPGNIIELQSSCVVCNKQARIDRINAISKSNSAKWQLTATEWQKYKSEVSKLTTITYRKHKATINPLNLPRGTAGMPDVYHLDHVVPKRFCFDNNIPAEICADKSNLQMLGWRENVGSRNYIKGVIPPLFLKYIPTGSKQHMYADMIKQMIPTVELFVSVGDIVVTAYEKQFNRAIVVIPIDQSQSRLKSAEVARKALTDANIDFIILFEDELNNSELIRSKLKHYIHVTDVERIHARKCIIKQCNSKEKNQLLRVNHVQGEDHASIAYGAYFQEKLVAVMTFSPPRIAAGSNGNRKPAGVWELSRFCTDVNYRIPGIASKLLKHFQNNHDWNEIYSFADKRWSVGNMYYQLGFSLVGDNKPSYFYIVDGKRKHRWGYRKDMIRDKLENFDPKLTELENMENHGYWSIWDCGTLKFSLVKQ